MAGRNRTIDRDHVLNAAEAVVREHGPAALTIDAVAKAAGITKGGVQYCFGTKDGLVDAMYDRWFRYFADRVTAGAGEDAGVATMLQAYLRVGLHSDTSADWERSAVMMAVLVQFSAQMERYRHDSRSYFERFDLSAPEGRRQALALVAADGMFLLRGFGFMQFSDEEWRVLAGEIEALVPAPSA